jgi:prepilin-type N-terminal cleavage/methylation domain-containing protein
MKRNRKNFRMERGFTLIEVLAAILLIGIVVPVAMHGISGALGAADTAHHTAEAAELGEQQLNQMIADGTITTASSGDFGAAYPAYSWTMQTNQRDYGVSELVMTITWNASGGQRSLKLSTMLSTETSTSTTTSSTTGAKP